MDTKHALVSIALKAFLERGYDAVPLKEIADAAGIKQASIYYHFQDKHALLEACAQQFFQHSGTNGWKKHCKWMLICKPCFRRSSVRWVWTALSLRSYTEHRRKRGSTVSCWISLRTALIIWRKCTRSMRHSMHCWRKKSMKRNRSVSYPQM